MIKYAEKSYYLDFLISLNFDSSGVRFWPYFAIFQDPTQFWVWGTLLGSNQCRKSKFGKIHLPYCKFEILVSSSLLVAFLVLEFKLKTFSNPLGPNDPKKVKKI